MKGVAGVPRSPGQHRSAARQRRPPSSRTRLGRRRRLATSSGAVKMLHHSVLLSDHLLCNSLVDLYWFASFLSAPPPAANGMSTENLYKIFSAAAQSAGISDAPADWHFRPMATVAVISVDTLAGEGIDRDGGVCGALRADAVVEARGGGALVGVRLAPDRPSATSVVSVRAGLPTKAAPSAVLASCRQR